MYSRRTAGTDRIPSLVVTPSVVANRAGRPVKRPLLTMNLSSERRLTTRTIACACSRPDNAAQRHRRASASTIGQSNMRRPRPAIPRRSISPTTNRARPPSQGAESCAVIQFANQFERPVVITLGIGLVSLVLMTSRIAARQSRLVDWMPIHLNAAGAPDHWGSPSTLWRLPLMVVMVTLMSAVLAWFAAKRDAFAVQFVLASTSLIQALCWVALVNLGMVNRVNRSRLGVPIPTMVRRASRYGEPHHHRPLAAGLHRDRPGL